MSRKGQDKASLPNSILAAVALIGIITAGFLGYPTIHPKAQGASEEVPLELIDGEKAYIQLENSGVASVAITVNFSSDGSMRFKNDKGQIIDSFELVYAIGSNELGYFPFTPVFNDTLKNATLIVRYGSNIECFPLLKPRQDEGNWQKVYGKTLETTGGMKRKWKLR